MRWCDRFDRWRGQPWSFVHLNDSKRRVHWRCRTSLTFVNKDLRPHTFLTFVNKVLGGNATLRVYHPGTKPIRLTLENHLSATEYTYRVLLSLHCQILWAAWYTHTPPTGSLPSPKFWGIGTFLIGPHKQFRQYDWFWRLRFWFCFKSITDFLARNFWCLSSFVVVVNVGSRIPLSPLLSCYYTVLSQ